MKELIPATTTIHINGATDLRIMMIPSDHIVRFLLLHNGVPVAQQITGKDWLYAAMGQDEIAVMLSPLDGGANRENCLR